MLGDHGGQRKAVDVVDLARRRAARRDRRSRCRSKESRPAAARRPPRGPGPAAAIAPTRLGVSVVRREARAGRCGCRRPAGRCSAPATAANTRTAPDASPSVSSTMTTASAPWRHRRAGGDLDALAGADRPLRHLALYTVSRRASGPARAPSAAPAVSCARTA